jgi:hypothetical protein
MRAACPSHCVRFLSLCHPDRSLRSGGTPDSGCVQSASTDDGEPCVTHAERRSVRRDSSLQQLSLRMTRGRLFLCHPERSEGSRRAFRLAAPVTQTSLYHEEAGTSHPNHTDLPPRRPADSPLYILKVSRPGIFGKLLRSRVATR